MRWAFATVAIAVTFAALLACDPSPPMPTLLLEPRPFVQRVTADGVLTAAKATRVGVPSDLEEAVRLAWIAPEGISVAAGDVIARFDPSEMESRLAAGENDLASATVEGRKTALENDTRLRELDTRVETARLELDLAQRFQKTDTGIFSRQDIAKSAIDQELATERQQNATVTRATQSALGGTRLDLVSIKQRKANLKIARARTGLAALEVRAPHAGLLTLVRNWRGEAPQIGSELWPGEEIAEIPDLATLQAEVYVLEADAGGLEVGKPAKVVVEAHPDTSYPATISRVDPVAKPRTRGSPVQFFGVTLTFRRADADLMKPGQRVRATLVLEQLADALVVPRQAVQQVNGEYRVLVRRGRAFVPCPVQLGPATAGLVVVSSGLAAGEVIALHPPPTDEQGPPSRPTEAPRGEG